MRGVKYVRHITIVGDNGVEYDYNDIAMTWSDAQLTCEKWNGYLLEINSQQQNDKIIQLLEDWYNTRYFIGNLVA